MIEELTSIRAIIKALPYANQSRLYYTNGKGDWYSHQLSYLNKVNPELTHELQVMYENLA